MARKTNFQDLYSKSLYTTPPLIAVALLLVFVSVVCLVGTNRSSSTRNRKLKDSTEKYALHLKIFYQKYTQKVSKWPPSNIKKLSRLAVIKKELNDTSTFNAETIHGCIDDIICGKEEIEIKELFVTDDDLKIVLVDGAPGIGKSTLALHICQLWANDECFTEYDLVVLLRFRDKAVREAKDVHDLFQYADSNNMEDVVEDIKSPKGPNLLLVLDGYDELLCEQSQNPLFDEILAGKILSSSTVLVTSRPAASQEICLNYDVSKHIEILGFLKNDIDHYIQEAFKGKKNLLNGFEKYISRYPFVRSMMYIPMNCTILAHMYQMAPQKMGTFQTITELYTSVLENLLLRYLRDRQQKSQGVISLTLSNLPSPIDSQFKKICELAHSGMMKPQPKLVFESSELPDDLDTLGLMQCDHQFHSTGESLSFNFLHSTFQEYLAAYHIYSQSGQCCPNTFIKKHINDVRLQVVVSFLSGLAKPKLSFWGDPAMEMVVNLPSPQGINMHFLRCLFESQVFISPQSMGTSSFPELAVTPSSTSWPQSTESVTFFYSGVIMPYDFYVLGHCIAHSKCLWRIQVQRPNCEDWLDELLKGLDTKRISEFIEKIDISYCDLGSNLQKLMKTPMHNLTHLVLYRTKLTASSLDVLTFTRLPKLQYLKLDWSNAGNSGLVQLVQSFSETSSTLAELHLRDTGIGIEDCEALGKLLEVAVCLKVLGLSRNDLDSNSTQCIIDGASKSVSLQNLQIAYSSPNIDSLLSLVTSKSKLKHLDISSCNLSSEDVSKFVETVANNPTLQYLSLSDNSADESSCAINKMIVGNKSLCFLFLQKCKLQGDDVNKITSALEQNNTLETLDLSKNILTSHHLAQFAEKLQSNSKLKNPKLKRLAIQTDASAAGTRGDLGKLVAAVQTHQNLTSLSLCGSDLGDSGAQIVAEQLIAREHRLCNLFLDKCSIESGGAHYIAIALTQNKKSCLKFLLMSRNPIEWKGVVDIIVHTNLLEEIDLRNTSEGPQRFTEVIETLRKKTCKLKKLWLSEDCKPYPSFKVEPQLQSVISFWSSDSKLSRYKHRNLLRKVLEGSMD